MAFRIHIAGSGGFRYSRSVRHDGGRWDIGWVKARLISWSVGHARPSRSGGNPIVAASAGATVAALREFSDRMTGLASVGVTELNIAIRVPRLLWATSGGVRHFALGGDSTDGIASEICEFLDTHGMNRWGVLFQMNRGLASCNGGPMVNVTLIDGSTATRGPSRRVTLRSGARRRRNP